MGWSEVEWSEVEWNVFTFLKLVISFDVLCCQFLLPYIKYTYSSGVHRVLPCCKTSELWDLH